MILRVSVLGVNDLTSVGRDGFMVDAGALGKKSVEIDKICSASGASGYFFFDCVNVITSM